MIMETWIIKRGTPESKHLKKLGFIRDMLPVTKWKGRSKSFKGYVRTPLEWKVEGRTDVIKLSKGIVQILDGRNNLTNAEEKSLNRAKRVLHHYQVTWEKEEKYIASAVRVAEKIKPLLMRLYPCAKEGVIDEVCLSIHENSVQDINELRRFAEEVIGGSVTIWKKSRRDFISTSSSTVGSTTTEV